MKKRQTQYEQIAMVFIQKEAECLKTTQIYEQLPEIPQPSIRRALRHDPEKRFKAVARGVYMLAKGNVKGLLIEGNGRKMVGIEDNSCAAIITDHPYKDGTAHKGGNRDFTPYETFKYTLEDFKEKARVIEPGGYVIEFLPHELASNVDYLYEIKKMAEKSGLSFYTKLLWKKPVSNTGRVKKCIEDIYVFSKGKPRILNEGCSNDKPLAYATKNMLEQILDYPINKATRNHPAEKPMELLEYLLEQFTKEEDIVVDQFGGSCNMIKAATKKNRFAIVYELCHDTVMKAVERFKMECIYQKEDIRYGV